VGHSYQKGENVAGVNRRVLRVLIASLVAGASELMPIPGMLLAFFLGGVHGPHPGAYLCVALLLNFVVVFAALYWVVGIVQNRISN
jgi:hypothetical protein